MRFVATWWWLGLAHFIDGIDGPFARTVRVRGLSEVRGPAPLAQGLYEETEASLAERRRLAEQRRQGVEPAHAIDPTRQTKRDRRQLADWQRWSASIDDEPGSPG